MCPTGTTAHRLSVPNPSLRSAFHVIDSDHDGLISQNDLREFYSSIFSTVGSDENIIGSMMQLADSNRDGFVAYEEFENVLEREEKGRRRERDGGVMAEVFKAMDRDGDGIVGHDDLKGFLKRAGFEAHDEDVLAMIRLGCVGCDDVAKGVTFDGFLKILALSDH